MKKRKKKASQNSAQLWPAVILTILEIVAVILEIVSQCT